VQHVLVVYFHMLTLRGQILRRLQRLLKFFSESIWSHTSSPLQEACHAVFL
jgi:hypothetical protein